MRKIAYAVRGFLTVRLAAAAGITVALVLYRQTPP